MLCPYWDMSFPVSSLALLSALLSRRGHEVDVRDLNQTMYKLEQAAGGLLVKDRPTPGDPWTDPGWVEREFLASYRGWLEGVARDVVDRGARVVGFSTYYPNVHVTLAVARMVKRRDPSVKVVLGGPSCLTFKECLEHLKHDCVDAVALGEADRSLPRLLDGLEKTGRLSASPGILLREDASTWVDAQDRLENLDELPFADFSGFGPLDSYTGKTIHTTRGCVRRCAFCADWREMPYRHMSGARVFSELEHQVSRDPAMTEFMFADSVLNGSLPDVEDFCGRLIATDLGLSWRGYAIVRPDMTPALLAKMRRAGCSSLYYGVESGSAKVLQDMSKNVPPAVNARALRDTLAAGIKPVATWIVGYPTETDELFEESLAFLRENASHVSWLTPSLFSICEVRDQAERLGLGDIRSDLFWSSRDGRNTFPVRLERLGRTLTLAAELGVKASYQGRLAAKDFPAYRERLLALYEESLAA